MIKSNIVILCRVSHRGSLNEVSQNTILTIEVYSLLQIVQKNTSKEKLGLINGKVIELVILPNCCE